MPPTINTLRFLHRCPAYFMDMPVWGAVGGLLNGDQPMVCGGLDHVQGLPRSKCQSVHLTELKRSQ